MNFVTSAAEALLKMQKICEAAKKGFDATVFESLRHDLSGSMKYIVPGPTLLNVKATETALPFIRLPYPICAFEYVIAAPVNKGLIGLETTSSTNRIALVYDLSAPTAFVVEMKRKGFIRAAAIGIAVISLYQIDSTKEWMPSIGFAVLDTGMTVTLDVARTYVHHNEKNGVVGREFDNSDGDFYLDNTQTNVSFSTYPLFDFAYKGLDKPPGHPENEFVMTTMVNDTAEELAMAIRVTLLLNTKNLKQVKLVDAPEKLNKKRARSDKLPFYTYHTLDIFVSNSPLRLARKRVDFGAVQGSFAKSNTRLQSVSGHFKVRKTGLFWWNFFIKGRAANGVIEKGYNLQNPIKLVDAPIIIVDAAWSHGSFERSQDRLNRNKT